MFSPDVLIKLDYEGKRVDMDQVSGHLYHSSVICIYIEFSC